MTPRKVILDCDPGMDDSMAIVLAVKSPVLDVCAITATHGNYPIEVTSANARKTLELLRRMDVPVARGAARPLVQDSPADPFTHGDDGQAGNHLPEPTMPLRARHAVDFIVETVNASPGEVTVIATGPLTNVALALRLDPDLAAKIERVVAISGAFGVNECAYTNATGDNPLSEWNVYVDPEAAQIVYESGVPLTAIGLDVATHFDVDFSDEEIERLRGSDLPEARFLATAVDFVRGRGYGAYCAVIDCVAVAHVIDDSLIETSPGLVGIETHGRLTRGMTVWDRRRHHEWTHLPTIDIARSADYRRFLDLLINTVLDEETR